ncbi:MAG: AAA family ATPase [Bryobacterales bacterium]|nr:AAA family ATPase [Bryobacterales bacterium]
MVPRSLPKDSFNDRRRLPIGIQAFRKLREDNCCYVDKTGFAVRLAREGIHYFLARPRRFGKSLFVGTLKEPIEGSRELFWQPTASGTGRYAIRS